MRFLDWHALGIRLVPVALATSTITLACTSAPPAASTAATTAPAAAASAAPAAQPAAAAPAAAASLAGKKFYWLQGLMGHPVHQLVQKGFMEGCKQQQIDCEIIGTPNDDIASALTLVGQANAKGNMAGISVWSGGSPLWIPEFQKLPQDMPMAIPHFVVPEGFYPAKHVYVISADAGKYAHEAADAMCNQLKSQGQDQAGSVAVTQGSVNVTENTVSAEFTAEMGQVCPKLKVLFPQEEGFDAPKAIAKAVAIMQANPDLVGALSTTGGGPTTWAGAQKQAGKKIPAIGMDYTRVNLDLVKSGDIFGIVAQPLWDESMKTAEMLKRSALGETLPYRTVLPAPIVTKDGTGENGLDHYYQIINQIPDFR